MSPVRDGVWHSPATSAADPARCAVFPRDSWVNILSVRDGIEWTVRLAFVAAEHIREVRLLVEQSHNFKSFLRLKVHAIPHVSDWLTRVLVADVIKVVIGNILDVRERDWYRSAAVSVI